MSFSSNPNNQDLSSHPHNPNHTDSPTSSAPRTSKSAHHHQAWGSSVQHPQQQQQQQQDHGAWRGLPPISTAPAASSQSPSRAAFSPTSSHPLATRQILSRDSSASSSSSLFSPLLSSSQHHQPRTAAASPHLASVAGHPSTAHSGAGAGIGAAGGGSSRPTSRLFARPSPSLSISTSTNNPTSPHSTGPQSAGPSSQLTSLVTTQLNILLSTLKENKDRAKWEAQVDKIAKVCTFRRQSMVCNMLTRFCLAGRCTRYGGVHSLLPPASPKQCLSDLSQCSAHQRQRWKLSAAR